METLPAVTFWTSCSSRPELYFSEFERQLTIIFNICLLLESIGNHYENFLCSYLVPYPCTLIAGAVSRDDHENCMVDHTFALLIKRKLFFRMKAYRTKFVKMTAIGYL